MADRPTVALVVDNPLRDLPGLTLLAARLCIEGLVCHLVPMQRQDLEIRSLAPDVVVMNYLRSGNERIVRQFLDAGIAVLISDTEGGILTSLDAYERTLSQAEDVRSRISRYCSWGTTLANHAVAKKWYRPDQVVITGAPRFDYYAPPWREAALASSPWADRLPTPLITINGNFPIANPRFQSPDKERRMLVEQFGHDPDEVAGWQSGQQLVLEELTALVNRLTARFPGSSFLYRPHPFEKLETYERYLVPRSNLAVEKTGTAEGWILRSCAVIQRNCTTAVEAGMAGVPALSPTWIPVPFEVKAAEGPSVKCPSETDLEHHLAACIRGEMVIPEETRSALNQTLEEWFFRVDGRSHERVATEVMSSLTPNDRNTHARRCAAIGRPYFESGAPVHQRLRTMARAQLKQWLPPTAARLQPSRSEPPWKRSEKQFGVNDVRATLVALSPLMGAPHDRLVAEQAGKAGSYVLPVHFGRAITIRRV